MKNIFFLLLICLTSTLSAADPVESDYYHITSFIAPDNTVLEVGAFDMLKSGELALSTRRGEVWTIKDPLTTTPSASQFHRFAHGLHEVLGLDEKDGWLYITQRCDVSRIKDTNNDGLADVFEVINGDWGITGDYHEYAFGSKFDKQGNIWVPLCLTGSFNSNAPYRGWCVRITPEGKMIPTCSGVRSPGGVGFDAEENVFYTDNQGPWNGTCGLKHLIPGKFVGHPGGNKWYELCAQEMGPKPKEPLDQSRFVVEADKIPEYEPAAILFPYGAMGQSASGIACDTTDGKFGPFKNQLFVGDQTRSTVMRCFLEKVDGHFQGACIPFLKGFGSGNLALEMTNGGHLFVGGTNRGWGSTGTKPFAIERVDYTGKIPFEIMKMEAQSDGFKLTFTQPVDPQTAGDIKSYLMQTFTYIYRAGYGSPEVDHTNPTIKSIAVAPDNMSVKLTIEGLQRGHVHKLVSAGVKSKEGSPLLHNEAYYTLNYIPKGN
jgi:hypothetical protein